MVTLPDGQLAEAQRQDAQAHGGRWLLPRRSVERQQPGYSRCAEGGKPRVLPRGIAGHSCVNQIAAVSCVPIALGVEYCMTVLALFAALGSSGGGGLVGAVALAAVVAGKDYSKFAARCENNITVKAIAGYVVDAAGVGGFLRDCEGSHFALLDLQPRCAADVVIIVHDALYVKEYFKLNLLGRSMPSNPAIQRDPAARILPFNRVPFQGSTPRVYSLPLSIIYVYIYNYY